MALAGPGNHSTTASSIGRWLTSRSSTRVAILGVGSLPASAVKTVPACGPDTLGRTGTAATALATTEAATTTVPANMRSVAAQWATWLKSQHLTGNGAIPDYANPLQMNRYTWYQAHDWKVPYPGDPKIYTPSQVPGAPLPSPETS